MNRAQRRARAADRFFCVCRHCGGRRSIAVGMRHGAKDLMAMNDCRCAPMATCDQCGEIGKHWLGCPYIGLPSMPDDATRPHGHPT